MKFDIGNVHDYEGEDLILLMGPPGSRWSQASLMICESPDINNSDRTPDRAWERPVVTLYGKNKTIGNHIGAYWGPGNLFGKQFDRLDSISKEEMLAEFMEAYETWDGIKVIKSHWFSYNIPYMHNMFPKAKIVMCYMNDIECYYWWHKCGGFGSGYANYSWYENSERLIQQIKEENANLLKFGIDRDLTFERMTKEEIWGSLDLQPSTTGDEATTTKKSMSTGKLSMYLGGYVPSFDHLA